jgi:ribose transport system substrate-binding protein
MSNIGLQLRPRRIAARGMSVIAGAVLAVAVAACGSGSGGAAKSDSSSPSTDAALAAAKEVAAQALGPSKFVVTQPVGVPIPSGKTIDIVTCAASECLTTPEAAQAAGKVLGWKVNIIAAGADPASLQDVFQQVVRERPNGVVYEGQDPTPFGAELRQLEALHIPVVAAGTVGAPGVSAVVQPEAFNADVGKTAAAYVASQSDGKADVLIANIPSYPIYQVMTASFEKWMKSYCNCSVTVLNLPAASLGTNATQMVANAVRQNPKINWVVNVLDSVSLGLPSMLRQAGRQDVKLFGVYPGSANLPAIADGQEAGAIPLAEDLYGWTWIDALARLITGQPVTPDEVVDILPIHIWNSENFKYDGNGQGVLPSLVTGYAADFEKLWGK